MNIIVYTKTNCPWAIDVIHFLNKNNTPYEERDIVKNEEFRDEVEQATNQNKSPTLNINGEWFCDAGIEDVALALGIKI